MRSLTLGLDMDDIVMHRTEREARNWTDQLLSPAAAEASRVGLLEQERREAGMSKAAAVQGSRDNGEKPPITMVLEATYAIEGIARVLQFGAKKYGRRNWMKGLKYTEIMDSSDRHELALLRGEDTDSESGLPHADHIACNALFLSQMMHTRPDMDDRCEH